MEIEEQNLQRELMQFLQRRRRHGRSLENKELEKLFKTGGFEKGMPSEALLSSSACPGASLSFEEKERSLDIKSTSKENK